MGRILIRPFPVANGRKDYMVVVKPHPGGTVNRHGIDYKKDARAYAAELQASLGFEVVDETK
jgi:hypothetical protein